MRKFKTTIVVRIDDINYGGHMGNDRYLTFFHEARLRFFKVLGFSEMDIGDGTSLTQAEAFISYKAEVFSGDRLEIGVFIDQISGLRFRVMYEMTRESDKKIVAHGYTLMVGFDYQLRKAKKIPQVFKQKVEAYAGDIVNENP
ncbi:acyl-CoA thioesterase [candidate division KSB1 bacterium]|nr:acyl-CoA thioesterase [candidate division KSB1 bacterium]